MSKLVILFQQLDRTNPYVVFKIKGRSVTRGFNLYVSIVFED